MTAGAEDEPAGREVEETGRHQPVAAPETSSTTDTSGWGIFGSLYQAYLRMLGSKQQQQETIESAQAIGMVSCLL